MRVVNMKIIIFGVGKIYKENKKYIPEWDKVIAFFDNNPKLWGNKIDDIVVYNPEDIIKLSFDKIVLMSAYAYEMQQQLLELGCSRECLIHYTEYINRQSIGRMQVIFPVKRWKVYNEKCLIITTELGYNGGSLAAVYAALAIQQKGYEAVIAAPKGVEMFVEEMRRKGISFIFYNNLSHAKAEELYWVDNFQYVIVNTLQMSCCAVEIAKHRKVILWLHEPSELYCRVNFWEKELEEGFKQESLGVYAVSSVARKNFTKNYFHKSVDILPYGIPKEMIPKTVQLRKGIIFAVVGSIIERKGQDLFIDAIEQINVNQADTFRFLIIGKMLDKKYGYEIEKRASQHSYVQVIGECTRNEMIKYYGEIDVLVIPSTEEPMSIVATEAMMLGKTCIIADTAGMADYVENYVNGLTFTTGDSKELAEKMLWCISNQAKLKGIGNQARNTYEKNFSLEVFGSRLESVMKQNV